jgi:hypothetical protein
VHDTNAGYAVAGLWIVYKSKRPKSANALANWEQMSVVNLPPRVLVDDERKNINEQQHPAPEDEGEEDSQLQPEVISSSVVFSSFDTSLVILTETYNTAI